MERTDHNCMLLNEARSEYLHFGRSHCPELLFPCPNSMSVPLPRAHCAKDRGVQIGSSLSPITQKDEAMASFIGMLAFLKSTFKILNTESAFLSISLSYVYTFFSLILPYYFPDFPRIISPFLFCD